MIVPFYNVEEYLAECLDSVLRQSYGDFEVVLVDDGSPDGSRAIAEKYVAQDPRVRLVTRENGGLGAARNTGIREARGRYLTFVDSDDILPTSALRVLVASAHATGSDIVVGSVERFDSVKSWAPAWADEVHVIGRTGITIHEFLPLLRNLYTWNKLFRRDFWEAQDLWFREGVAYEDQPIVTQLFARAAAIDVLPDIVYRYRLRDDKSSISQQTASLKDLRDRIAAWRTTRDTLRAEATEELYQGWLATLFDAHFQWYLTSSGTVDDVYWNELLEAVRELSADAEDWVWDATYPTRRVLVRLAVLGRRRDAQEFVRRDALKADLWPAEVREDGVRLHLPQEPDEGLEEDLFLIRPEQLQMSHAVENLHWVYGPDGTSACQLSGWAFLRKVDLAKHSSTVTVLLRDESTGEEVQVVSDTQPTASFPPPLEDTWCDYRPGRFGVEIPLHDLVAGTTSGTTWSLWLRVEAAGFSVTRPVTRLLRSGAAGMIPALRLGGGGRLIADWQYAQQLKLRVERQGERVLSATLEGRSLRIRVQDADAALVGGRAWCRGGHEATMRASSSGGVTELSAVLPEVGSLKPGATADWRVAALTVDGRQVALVPGPDATLDAGETAPRLVLETNRNGELVVTEWALGAVADHISVSSAGVLQVTGRAFGVGDGTVTLTTRNKRTRTRGDAATVVDGTFTATLELRHELYRFGRRPLPIGEHDLWLAISPDGGSSRETITVRLPVSPLLSAELPVLVDTDEHDGRVVRGPEGVVRVTLLRPLGAARGRYEQNRLRLGGATRTTPTRGVLMRAYFGEQVTDNGLSIQRELQRRGSDLPVYWAVQDHSLPVPEGGIPVVVNSTEWYELLSSVTYYIDNMYQPDYHRKPAGQVMVQTFHGYPFKRMGHPHWESLQFSQARIDAYDARAAEWDYLVSPARYATELLVRDFAYPGQVLEIGYPRNDALQAPDADEVRRLTRESLGIREDQTAVLYAPTFRDYLAANDAQAVMADFFDFAEAHQRLGDGYVILVRGHAFNARSHHRVGQLPGCVDVTDYPEVSDLYLAADAAVVDYSSLRFDFGVTGKPMVFHVPDLQRYKDTRGWLFDFELSAPGPLVSTTAEVADRLADLEGVRREFAGAYETFRADFLDLEDGRAGARFVDAVFVPRGDAPPDRVTRTELAEDSRENREQ